MADPYPKPYSPGTLVRIIWPDEMYNGDPTIVEYNYGYEAPGAMTLETRESLEHWLAQQQEDGFFYTKQTPGTGNLVRDTSLAHGTQGIMVIETYVQKKWHDASPQRYHDTIWCKILHQEKTCWVNQAMLARMYPRGAETTV